MMHAIMATSYLSDRILRRAKNELGTIDEAMFFTLLATDAKLLCEAAEIASRE